MTYSPIRPYGSSTGPLTIRGKYFYTGSDLWRWRGLTAFLLLKRILEGREAEALRYLDWAASIGVNVVRVFSQVKWTAGANFEDGFFAAGFEPAFYDHAVDSLFMMAAGRGLRVELVAHTFPYDLGPMLAHSRRIDALCAQHANALFEDANEPPVNQIPIADLCASFTPRTLASSGQYDPSPWPARKWVNDHPPRDAEFCRKFKGGVEFGDGSGPYVSFSPPWPGPVVFDEPERIERLGNPDEWQSFAAGSAMFGAGATIHGGQWAQCCTVPTDPEILARIQAFRDGLSVVPLQTYTGYQHPDDRGSLRRYRRQGADGAWYEISVRPYEFFRV